MNEPAEHDSTRHQRRFPRLRWTTWILIVLLTAAAIGANWPVEYSSAQQTQRNLALFWLGVSLRKQGEPFTPSVHGGIPFRYYSQTSNNLLTSQLEPLPPCVYWSSAALLGNIAAATALIALAALWWEWRCRRRQRWLQLSLADLALAVVLLAIPLAWYGTQRNRYLRERHFQALPSVTATSSSREAPWWLAEMLPHERLWLFETITAARCASPDAETFRELSRLHGLESLSLLGDYTAEDLRKITKLPLLRRLDLGHVADDDEVLQVVAGLSQLQSLALADLNSTSQSLEPLPALKHLHSLDLQGSGIDDDAMVHIGRIRSLSFLRLPTGSFTGSGFLHLHGHPNLRTLELAPTMRQKDKPLSEIDLRGLPQLESLRIDKKALRVHLEDLPKLQELPTPPVMGPFSEFSSFYNAEPYLGADHLVLRDMPALRTVSLVGEQLKTLQVAGLPGLREFRVFPVATPYGLALLRSNGQHQRAPYKPVPDVMAAIGRMMSLQSLELPAVILADEDMAAIGRCQNLQRLVLASAEISDHGMSHLSRVTELRELNLQHTGIGDEGWSHLPRMERLETLNLNLNAITRLDLQSLKALTHLSINELPLKSLRLGDLPALEGQLRLRDLDLEDVRVVAVPKLERIYLKDCEFDSLCLEGLDGLQTLHLQNAGVTDKDLEHVASCSRITDLQLSGPGVTDTGMREVVARFTRLESLGLEDTLVTDEGLEPLANLKFLDRLNLTGTAVTDRGLETVGRMRAIQLLYLGRTQVEGPGLVHLKNLPFLRKLSLGKTRVDNDAVQHLAGRSLEWLRLSDTAIDDRAFASIARLPMLKTLYVDGCNVTSKGLKQLAPLRLLKSVDARDTKVTERDCSRLPWKVLTGIRE